MWIRNLLRSLAAEGRTVFVSSHLMSEMAMTADRLIVIGRGRLIAETTMADFIAAGPAARAGPLAAGQRLAALLRRAAPRSPARRRHAARHRRRPPRTIGDLAARTG